MTLAFYCSLRISVKRKSPLRKDFSSLKGLLCLNYFFKTAFAKSSKESPFRKSLSFTRLKKQLGTSFSFKFFAMQGAHPLLCFVGCKGQSVFLQLQNLLKFSISFRHPIKYRNNVFSNSAILFFRTTADANAPGNFSVNKQRISTCHQCNTRVICLNRHQ